MLRCIAVLLRVALWPTLRRVLVLVLRGIRGSTAVVGVVRLLLLVGIGWLLGMLVALMLLLLVLLLIIGWLLVMALSVRVPRVACMNMTGMQVLDRSDRLASVGGVAEGCIIKVQKV